jgi:hypothetical protein
MKRALAAVVVATTLLSGIAAQAKGDTSVDAGILPDSRWYLLDQALETIGQWLRVSPKSRIAYIEKRMREREAEALAFALRQGESSFDTGPLSDEAIDILGLRLQQKREALEATKGIGDPAEQAEAIAGIQDRAWAFDKEYLAKIADLKASAEAQKSELLEKIAAARKAGDRAESAVLQDRYADATAKATALDNREYQLIWADGRQAETFENGLTGAEKAQLVFARVEQGNPGKEAAALLEKGKAALAEGDLKKLDRLASGLQATLPALRNDARKRQAAEDAKKDPAVEQKKPEAPKKPAAQPKPATQPKPVAQPKVPAAPKTPLETIPSESVQTEPLTLIYYPNINGQVGVPVNAQYGGQGGLPPYHFKLESGVGFPPLGVIFDANGLLSGTPKGHGVFVFSACVVDTAGNSVCEKTNMVVAGAAEPEPAPAPAPLPEPGPAPEPATPFTLSLGSRTCSVRETYSDGSNSEWVNVAGSAGGPVGTRVRADTSSGVTVNCGAWHADTGWSCTRQQGDSENAQWSFRLTSYTEGSVAYIYAGTPDGDAKSLQFIRHCNDF